jgi:molybdopterin/thiamine biosynthesis adenylyltransferase
LDRHAREAVLPWFGAEGVRKLKASSVLVVGCGGTGCACSSFLVRAGLGRIVLVDGDVVNPTDLDRQILYHEPDIDRLSMKVKSAEAALSRANHETEIETIPAEFSSANAGALAGRVDLIVDCSDNFETRMLINDVCLKYSKPWVHGACTKTSGMIIPFPRDAGACYRCVVDRIPGTSTPAGEASGILGPVAGMTGSLEAAEAMKMLIVPDEVRTQIIHFDTRSYTYETIAVKRREGCPACVGRRFDFLASGPVLPVYMEPGSGTIRVHLQGPIDLMAVRDKLAETSEVEDLGQALRIATSEAEFILLSDGAAIVRGAADPERAKALVGSLLNR